MALDNALTTVVAALNPKSKKLAASLTSIRAELVNGPPPRQGFAGSPVDTIAKTSGKINAVTLSQLASAFAKGRRRTWNQLLEQAGVWVWKVDPETVLSAYSWAPGVINSAAAAINVNAGLQANATPSIVNGWLHNRASDPALHETVIAAIVEACPRRNGELWEFISFLRRAFKK